MNCHHSEGVRIYPPCSSVFKNTIKTSKQTSGTWWHLQRNVPETHNALQAYKENYSWSQLYMCFFSFAFVFCSLWTVISHMSKFFRNSIQCSVIIFVGKNPKKNGCVYIYKWITLLYSRYYYNIENQLYFYKTLKKFPTLINEKKSVNPF